MKHLILLATVIMLLSCQTGTKNDKISTEEAKSIAEEAYIYAYPMLDNYKVMYVYSIWEESPTFVAPLNTLDNSALLRGPQDTEVVRPNNDTYYTTAMLDLRMEPMLLSVL